MIRSQRSMLFAFVLLSPAGAVAGSLPSGPARLPDSASKPATGNTPLCMSADEIQTLRAIREESRQRVAALTEAFPNLTGPEREALEQQVQKIKVEAELAFLRAHIHFAEAKKEPGDIQEAKRALELFSQSLSPTAVYNVDAYSGLPPYWDAPLVPRNYAEGDRSLHEGKRGALHLRPERCHKP